MTTPIQKDARNRALRVLLQGFFIDVLVALATVSYSILTSENFAWGILGLAVAKTFLQTACSYVMRLKLGGILIEPNKSEPVVVQIGDHTLELQRPGVADHAAVS